MSTFMSTLCLSTVMWLLKLSSDQKSIIIHHKSNGDFKSYITFGGHKVNMGLTYIITQ
jgi:hypothetical protein